MEMASVSERILNEIWEKAASEDGYSPDKWRKDFAGAWIQRDQYGLSSEYGWDVCHLVPAANGGGDEIGNLLPIHWENHRMKSNRYPVFRTAVTSSGEKNIHEERIWKIKS